MKYSYGPRNRWPYNSFGGNPLTIFRLFAMVLTWILSIPPEWILS